MIDKQRAHDHAVGTSLLLEPFYVLLDTRAPLYARDASHNYT